jgi:EAL domain-containing protein (putative c-di-GMP-specific phosphodiesterase class I)
MMQDSGKTISALHRLKNIGVRIAMYDFETGYSSRGYLRKILFDKIKTDRAFVSNIEESHEQHAIVEAVICIAQALRMVTTADGVQIIGQKHIVAGL